MGIFNHWVHQMSRMTNYLYPRNYYYKGHAYEIIMKTKLKVDDTWHPAVMYHCLFNNPDGMYWVRKEEDFNRLFKLKKP